MAQRFIMPIVQVFDGNGTPYPYAKLYFYATGTSNLKDTYSDDTFTSANSNPILSDSAGRFIANIFLNTQAGRYKVILKDQNDTIIWTKDPVGLETTTSIKGAKQGCMWFFSGTKSELDSLLLDGWFICDGNNFTPDMREKYFLVTGTPAQIGTEGGANTRTPVATVGSTVLTENQLPVHNHVPDVDPPYVCSFNNDVLDVVSGDWTFRFATGYRDRRDTMLSVGGGGGHNHDSDINDVSNEPPYYTLLALRFGNA